MRMTKAMVPKIQVLRKEVIPCPTKMEPDRATPNPAGAKATAVASKEKKAAAVAAEDDKVATVAAVREEAVAAFGMRRLERLNLLRLDAI